MKTLQRIETTLRKNEIESGHMTLARFLQQQFPQAGELDLWLSVLVNMEISRGNVCLPMSDLVEKSVQAGWPDLPDQQSLLQQLQASPLLTSHDTQAPLVLDHDKLYLNRFYHQENNIATSLLARSLQPAAEIPRDMIERFFPQRSQIDEQQLAAVISSRHALAIISGGPGTGKTWTVSRILAILLLRQPQLDIQLAAPTGKAAARMAESIQNSLQQLDLDDELKQRLPTRAQTLHRLLQIHRYTHRASFDSQNPLRCDVLVVDEASMIDQQMMAMLCAALPPQGKLILLGDKDQLASVEAGSVFADLCGNLTETSSTVAQAEYLHQQFAMTVKPYDGDYALADQVVVLQKSRRFDHDSGIGRLAALVNRGAGDEAVDLLRQATQTDVLRWREPADPALPEMLRQQAEQDSLQMMLAGSIEQAFEAYHRSQILSAQWQGPGGVDTINSLIEQHLRKCRNIPANETFYRGKPLMMTSNVYQYQIHNGDIGLVWPDANGELKLWFEQGRGSYHMLSLSQCPAHKSAYAMTVHKSQGSEFKRVLLLLPSAPGPVVTRELLYTAITRASEQVEIWSVEATLRYAIGHKTRRVSGLLQRLQKQKPTA